MESNDVLADLDALPIVEAEVIAPLHDPDFGGDASFLSEVVEAFREDSPPRLAALREAHARRDGATLMQAAHTLKGSSGNFGAARLQVLCAEIERLGREDQVDGVLPLIDRLDVEYALLLDYLDRLIEATPTTS